MKIPDLEARIEAARRDMSKRRDTDYWDAHFALKAAFPELFTDPPQAWIAPEEILRGLLHGEYSSLMLSFNDDFSPNYMTAAAWDECGSEWLGDWVSEAERKKAIAENSVWTLQWYPETPVGFNAISASSLPALFAHLAKQKEGG